MFTAAMSMAICLGAPTQAGTLDRSISELLDAMPEAATSVACADVRRLLAVEPRWDYTATAIVHEATVLANIDADVVAAVVAGSEFGLPTNYGTADFNGRFILVLDQDFDDLIDRLREGARADVITHESEGLTVLEWTLERQYEFQGPIVRERVFVACPDARTIVTAESLAEATDIAGRLRDGPPDESRGRWSSLALQEELEAPAILVRRCGVRHFGAESSPVLWEVPEKGVLVIAILEAPRVTLTFRYEGEDAMDVNEALYNMFHVRDGADVRREDFTSGTRSEDRVRSDIPDWAGANIYDLFGVFVAW